LLPLNPDLREATPPFPLRFRVGVSVWAQTTRDSHVSSVGFREGGR